MGKAQAAQPDGIEITGRMTKEYEEILTDDAMAFVAELARKFGPQRDALLERREEIQQELDAESFPDFLPKTKEIRESDWKVAPIPKDLQDRRVEITGPVDRKMIINALNSGARVFMADCEDSLTPSWDNLMQGQINLRDAVNRTISFKNPDGKEYRLNDETAVLIVRPRGWHLDEVHFKVDGKPVPGALMDFGLYFFHNAKALLNQGTGPYFYIPKLENHLEAQLWNDVFLFAQEQFGLPRGTIKATVLIEVILAVYEMDEILYEMKDHIVGLNCGRWDYIFSYIKKFRNHPDRILPERGQVVMSVPFLKAYSELLIKTCHRRGAFAMGGMAAAIPVKNDDEANRKAFAAVQADKEREVSYGHDGTWVAHPALVPVARDVFDKHLNGPNQLGVAREEVSVTAAELIAVPEGTITEAGMRNNISVCLQYMAAWLNGQGAVPIFNLMEDAATAEIARAQLWQWLKYGSKLDDGREVTKELFEQLVEEEYGKLTQSENLQKARELLELLVLKTEFEEFLTLPAYKELK